MRYLYQYVLLYHAIQLLESNHLNTHTFQQNYHFHAIVRLSANRQVCLLINRQIF
nr:MAG TPA: hypothetical protein [Caudoviricetes sp.]